MCNVAWLEMLIIASTNEVLKAIDFKLEKNHLCNVDTNFLPNDHLIFSSEYICRIASTAITGSN